MNYCLMRVDTLRHNARHNRAGLIEDAIRKTKAFKEWQKNNG